MIHGIIWYDVYVESRGFICDDSNFCILCKYSFGCNLTLRRRKQTIKHTMSFYQLVRIRWFMNYFDLKRIWSRAASFVLRMILDVLRTILGFLGQTGTILIRFLYSDMWLHPYNVWLSSFREWDYPQGCLSRHSMVISSTTTTKASYNPASTCFVSWLWVKL